MTACLALNASFEPLTLISMKRAVRLVVDGKAEVVEADATRPVVWGRGSMPRPTVIKLKRFIMVPRRFRRKVTNTFLFARDGYSCQYCGTHQRDLNHRIGLTRDHVVPVSRGGDTSWTNCTTACSPCNAKKDDKLPREAGMELLSVPTEPHFVALVWSVRRLTPLQAKYVEMFYGSEVVKALAK